MNNLPTTPVDLFTQLLSGGVLYGLVSTWLIDVIIRRWERRVRGRISETKRRWVSVAVAVAVPVLAYGGLVALGTAALSVDGVYSAALIGIAACGGSKISYASRASKAKPSGGPLGDDPAYRARNDASGDPDAPNGGHPMRAVPAPQDAPPGDAGAPSLAAQLERDLGLGPEPAPEDTV